MLLNVVTVQNVVNGYPLNLQCFSVFRPVNPNNLNMFFNLLPRNVSLMEKPGEWFLLAKCMKNTC